MSGEDTKVENIIHSPCNKSKSKHTFSFPKQERFEGITKKDCSKTFHYEIPEVRNRRSTSMGYGKKLLMHCESYCSHINQKTFVMTTQSAHWFMENGYHNAQIQD